MSKRFTLLCCQRKTRTPTVWIRAISHDTTHTHTHTHTRIHPVIFCRHLKYFSQIRLFCEWGEGITSDSTPAWFQNVVYPSKSYVRVSLAPSNTQIGFVCKLQVPQSEGNTRRIAPQKDASTMCFARTLAQCALENLQTTVLVGQRFSSVHSMFHSIVKDSPSASRSRCRRTWPRSSGR